MTSELQKLMNLSAALAEHDSDCRSRVNRPCDCGANAFRRPPWSIVCPRCQRRSFHPNDITERYCGACRMFHEDMHD